MKSLWMIVCGAFVTTLLAGCAGEETTSNSETKVSNEAGSYVLTSEPAGAQNVKKVRADAKNDEEITIVGRVGGDADPFVSGQAAFMLVDTSLKPCPAEEGCPTPWDYCCDLDALPTAKVLVKVVDDQDRVVATDARAFGLKELQTVVVHGKARRSESGAVTVLADGLFIRP